MNIVRRQGAPWVVVAALALVACSGSGTAPNPKSDAGTVCGPCPAGNGCDAPTKTCVPASQAGGLCGSSALDGGPKACVDGTTCGPVASGDEVCAHDCKAATDCGTEQACFANPATLPARDYCATKVGLGGACSIDRLLECTGSNGAVVACVGNAAGGVCYARCLKATDCPLGSSCSSAFSDGEGVCVPPTVEGSPCNESDPSHYVLCSAGQLCVLEANGAGICHASCGVDAGACPASETCAYFDPCSDVNGFCVSPVATGASCNPGADQFCAADADCVNLATGLTCEADCTTGQTCPTGTTCNALPATDGGVTCRRACF